MFKHSCQEVIQVFLLVNARHLGLFAEQVSVGLWPGESCARSSFGHFKQVMWHCVGFACELLPLKALRYPEPQLYSVSQCFPFYAKSTYALWFDIMFNFLYLLLQIPSSIAWNTSLWVWQSMIWCEEREDRICVYQLLLMLMLWPLAVTPHNLHT